LYRLVVLDGGKTNLIGSRNCETLTMPVNKGLSFLETVGSAKKQGGKGTDDGNKTKNKRPRG